MLRAPRAAPLTPHAPPTPGARPHLVVGLGNPIAGDDGVGFRLAEALAMDPRLPRDVEVLCGGADVLRLAPWFDSRRDILFIDACLGVRPGELRVVSHDEARQLGSSRAHAHRLSPVEGVELLLRVTPGLSSRAIRWALVGVPHVAHGDALSPAMSAAVPHLVDQLVTSLPRG